MKSNYKPDMASCMACQYVRQWNPCSACIQASDPYGIIPNADTGGCKECCWHLTTPCASCSRFGGDVQGTESDMFKETVPPDTADTSIEEAEELEMLAEDFRAEEPAQ